MGSSVISPCRWRPGIRDGIGESRRHFGHNRRSARAGDRVRLWADGTIWKARKTGSNDRSAQGAAWSAAGQGAGDTGGPAIELTQRADFESPLRKVPIVPMLCPTATSSFIAPALGRPLNSSAAPDVRAPSVRGRWHFGGRFGPFYVYTPQSELRLGFARSGGYTLAT